MKSVRTEIHDKYAEWRYKGLYIVGIQGRTDRTIDEIKKGMGDRIEFMDVTHLEGENSLLIGFDHSVPSEVTFYQEDHGILTSLFSVSTEEQEAKKFTFGLAKRIGMGIIRPRNWFIEGINEGEVPFEVRQYNKAMHLSEEFRIKLSDIYGAVKYENFLYEYLDVPHKKARKLAMKRFGIGQ